jgi:hypothetical protein
MVISRMPGITVSHNPPPGDPALLFRDAGQDNSPEGAASDDVLFQGQDKLIQPGDRELTEYDAHPHTVIQVQCTRTVREPVADT